MLEKCYIAAKLENLSQLKQTNCKLSHYFPVLVYKWKTHILIAVCIIYVSGMFLCVCVCVCVFVCVCVCACMRVGEGWLEPFFSPMPPKEGKHSPQSFELSFEA